MAKAPITISPEERDAQLRRRMLNAARLSKGQFHAGFVPFNVLARVRDDQDQPCDDESHQVRLINDLVEWNLLEEAGREGLGGAKPNNQHRRFKMTPKAFELWTQSIDPIPGVADDRLL